MCGRFTLTTELDDIIETFSIENNLIDYTARFNIAPSQTVAVISNAEGTRVLDGYRWGLVPRWAKDIKIGYSMINARAETVESKPAFRNLLSRNRIILVADGFYEWKTEGKEKQPYRFQVDSGRVYGFAGLFDEWKDPNGKLIRSCTIITTTANALVQPIHNRMPVILQPESVAPWLDSSTDRKQVLELLKPYPAESMFKYPVSKKVGNVKNIESDLINKVELNSK